MNVLQHLLQASGLRRGPTPRGAGAPVAWGPHAAAEQEDDGFVSAANGEADTIGRLMQDNAQLQAENQAQRQMFAAAIHDLRQPLQALMLFSEALAQTPPSVQQQRHAASIRHSVASLDRLCVGLLDLTQITAPSTKPHMQPVALAPLLAQLQETFGCVARAQGLRLVVRPSTLHVQGDAVMLTRILNNLVCNALAHTRQGGVLVGVRRVKGCVRIDVCDTGEGMEPGLLGRLAEPSDWPVAPVGAAGAGTGLRTVQRLASWHDAEVRAQSRPGRGTTVSIEGLRSAVP